MKVRITLDMDVGDVPDADAISYWIHQYDCGPADGFVVPTEELVERCVLEVVESGDLADFEYTSHWSVLASHVEVI